MRTGLLKRFESSVHAFRLTCETMIVAHEAFLASLDEGHVLVPASRRTRGNEADDPGTLAGELGDDWRPIDEYDSVGLRNDVESDIKLLRAFRAVVAGASIFNDPKLEALSELLWREMAGEEKAIIFTYYADTADWIEQALRATMLCRSSIAWYSCASRSSKRRCSPRPAPSSSVRMFGRAERSGYR